MARRQREVRKYAKLQAKEQAKAQREFGGSPTISSRYQAWKQRRAIKKQAKALRWQQLQEQHATLGWLKRHESKFFWLFALGLVTVFAGYITVEARKSEALAKQKAEASRAMVTINGRPIYIEAVLDRTFFAYGATVLQELTEQELVRQEAERLKIELTVEEVAKIETLLENQPQKRVVKPRLEMAFLARHLILRGVTDERRKEVYEDFKEDVTTYSVTMFPFVDKANAEKFAADLKAGKDILLTSVTYTLDAKKPSSMGDLTPARLDRLFGKFTTKVIMALDPGQMTAPMNRDGKFMIFRLDGVKSSYAEVQEAIDTLIVDAESWQFMFDLIAKAKIDSPYINPETSDFKDDAPAPSEPLKATPSATPE